MKIVRNRGQRDGYTTAAYKAPIELDDLIAREPYPAKPYRLHTPIPMDEAREAVRVAVAGAREECGR